MNNAYNPNNTASNNKREAGSGTVKNQQMPSQNGQDASGNRDSSASRPRIKFYTPPSNYMQIGTSSQLQVF